MILPRVVQPAIIKIPAFFALRCEGAGIHSKSDVEYARIANATDDPNIPRLNVPRKWADYIHGFFYPDHCASILMVLLYSSLGWRNLCSQQSHCIHCSLFSSRNVEHPITTQRIFVQLNLISTSTSASTAHGTFWTNKVHEEWRRWMRGTRILEQWTFNDGTNKISQIHNW